MRAPQRAAARNLEGRGGVEGEGLRGGRGGRDEKRENRWRLYSLTMKSIELRSSASSRAHSRYWTERKDTQAISTNHSRQRAEVDLRGGTAVQREEGDGRSATGIRRNRSQDEAHHVGRHILAPPERQRPLAARLGNLLCQGLLPRVRLSIAAELRSQRQSVSGHRRGRAVAEDG